MKKLLRTILLLLPALLILFALHLGAVFADASSTCGTGCTWSFADGTLTISGSGRMENYGGTDQPWNRSKASIKTVSVDGVTYIGNNAFYNFPVLESVTIGASVKEIGMSAFSNCGSLSEVSFNQSSILTTIGSSAFQGCGALSRIAMPASLRTIGDSAFMNCYSLGSLTIPNGVETIGGWAFSYCYELTSVDIPASVTSIGDNPFRSCSNLGSITVNSGNPAYMAVDGVLFSENGENLIIFPAGKSGSYSIPESVNNIAPFAFSGCRGLTSLRIPGNVTEIGYGAFSFCSGLTSVIIPDSVTHIGERAFGGCTNLTSAVLLPELPPGVGEFPFESISRGCKFFVRNESYLRNLQWWRAAFEYVGWPAVISTITAGPGITFSAEPAKHTYNGIDYYESGSTITLNVPAGYAAEASWNGNPITPDSSGVYAFKMPAKDVTISASIEIITYTLAYELNGGALAPGESNPGSYTVESETIILKEPVKKGHLFGGWYETADFSGSPVREIPHGSVGNMTLYARWLLPVTLTAQSRTVIYDTSEHVVTGFSSSVPGLTFPGVHAEGRGTDAGSYPVTFTGVTLGKTEDSTGKYVVTETIEGTLTVEQAENPAIIEAEDYLTRGGHTLDLKNYVKNAAGDVSFTLKEPNGCTLEGTVLTSGGRTGDCIVEVTITGDKNHKPASGMLTVKVIEKATGTLTVTQQGTVYGTPLPDPVWQIQPETVSGQKTLSGTALSEIISEHISYSGHLHDGSTYGPAAEKPSQAGQYVVEVVAETRSVVYYGYSEVFTIERKAVTVRAEDKSKTQGEADPELTASVTGLLGGDSVSYDLSREAGEEPGDYVIHVSGETLQGNYKTVFEPGTFTIIRKEDPGPDPDPDPEPVDPQIPVFFRLPELPKTGFPTRHSTMIDTVPQRVSCRPAGLTFQIPRLDVSASIVTVPLVGDQYPVEWLGNEAGMLEGSAEPGKGYTVLTGHNHLSTTEAGPFALLQLLKEGDLIFILDAEGTLKPFTVYANEKISAHDSAALEKIAKEHADSLTLLTCEDETPDGTYQNRRVISAKPR